MSKKTYEQLVSEAKEVIRSMSDCSWKLGDLSLQAVPKMSQRKSSSAAHAKRYHNIKSPLQQWAEDIGWESSLNTLSTYRSVASRYPKSKRNPNNSFQVHEILASKSNRFELVAKNMTISEARKIGGYANPIPSAFTKVLSIQDVYNRLKASASWMRSATTLLNQLDLSNDQLETLGYLIHEFDQARESFLEACGMIESLV